MTNTMLVYYVQTTMVKNKNSNLKDNSINYLNTPVRRIMKMRK